MSIESCSGWQPRSPKKHTPSFSNSEIFRRLHACKHFIFVFWEAGNVSKDAGQNCCCPLACPFRRPQRHHHLVSLEPIKTSNEIPACVTRKIATLTRSWAVAARRRRSLCVPVNRSLSLLKKWGKEWSNSVVLRAILGKFYFLWNGFLSKNIHRRSSTRLTVCLGFVARATAWVTVEVFFDGLFRHFLFSRFLHSQIYCWKGVHPSTVPNRPILCLWTSLFFSVFPRFFCRIPTPIGTK